MPFPDEPAYPVIPSIVSPQPTISLQPLKIPQYPNSDFDSQPSVVKSVKLKHHRPFNRRHSLRPIIFASAFVIKVFLLLLWSTNSMNITPFKKLFPLPFRVLVLFTVGVYCWGLNVLILQANGIPINSVMQQERISRAKPIIRIALILSAVIVLGLWTFWSLQDSGNDPSWVVTICYAVTMAVVLCPLPVIHKRERIEFLGALRRVVYAPISAKVYFGDVIFADILTSFSKVLGDLYGTIFSIIFYTTDTTAAAAGYRRYIAPFIVSLPYFFRLRQCIAEYFQSLQSPSFPTPPVQTDSSNRPIQTYLPTPKSAKTRHLLNALKYSSAFPVILLSALQRTEIYPTTVNQTTMTLPLVNSPIERNSTIQADIIRLVARNTPADDSPAIQNHHQGLFTWWILFALFNTLYSFYWDIFIDWNLGYKSNRYIPLTESDYPIRSTSYNTRHQSQFFFPFLRPTLKFHFAWYYLSIILDFLFRFTWSIKLSSHLYMDHEAVVFVIEILEIIRRWMWCFLRIEREWITTKERTNPGGGDRSIGLGIIRSHEEQD
ncbi:EXS family-domain-containing protein [Paraphysoderma sedebokerense]|nr:EXS family-domain-containing protein [Paraphysoderma sedebokerense]